tara:strand:+ start:50978 stop:52393 length:1416 start_codon:yes stop_codon:yes gene_type:complete
MKINKDDLGYLGKDFQYRLIQQIIVDRHFGESIIDILDANYFEDTFLRKVASKIKDNYEKYETVPDMVDLESILIEDIIDDIDKEIFLNNLSEIKNAELHNGLRIQDTGMKFCKQQELKKSIREIEKIIAKGDLDEYPQCEEIIKKALAVGDNKDAGIDVFHDIENVMSDDFRHPIATGIDGLDAIMDGGLAKGELAVILAALGVGKTTMMTKLGNHAKNIGNNVLQIFFEDNPKVIQRKHYTCWMEGKFTLNELKENKDEVIATALKRQLQPGIIKLVKFPSHGTTMLDIRNYVRKQMAEGFKPDIILLDYIDCVAPTRQFKESWGGDGLVMRQFESMLSELDIAGWTAIQGNRSSISSDIVEADQMGGSISKGQIGHFIVSVAKSLPQKDAGTANMAILKSRFGKDGVVFENVVFDNARVDISMTKDNERGKSFLASQAGRDEAAQDKVNKIMDAIQQRKELLDEEENI